MCSIMRVTGVFNHVTITCVTGVFNNVQSCGRVFDHVAGVFNHVTGVFNHLSDRSIQ